MTEKQTELNLVPADYAGSVNTFVVQCSWCQKPTVVKMPYEHFLEWRNGKHVQNVFPELKPDQRELLISGTHPECWDEMFATEEEDDD